MTQAHDYNAELSYHLVNMALVGEVQPYWETDEPQHEDLEDIFAIPKKYYSDLFLGSNTPIDDIYEDIHGYIKDHYDLIGAMRIGEYIIPDYEEFDEQWTINDIDSLERMVKVMTSYSQRVTESLTNSVRYSFSRLLMGYALQAKDESHAIIVMRGTVTTDEWLNNFNYRLVPFYLHDDTYGNVHNGFRDVYKGVRGRYRELVDSFPVDMPLYLVGHSLGAAVSQLAALDIAVKSPERIPYIDVYGYAPPRVGDATFAKAYNRLVSTSYRIVNICDMVPYVPFEEIGKIINQEGYPYADTKGEIAYIHQMCNPIANHISSYHLATKAKIPSVMDASQPSRL